MEIKIKGYKDEISQLIEWTNYFTLLAKSDMINNVADKLKFLNRAMVRDLLLQTLDKFKRASVSKSAKPTTTLTYSEAAAFYVHLMKLPIAASQEWKCLLRQRICNFLHQELFQYMPAPFEVPQTTLSYSEWEM
jgi:hypothetical protein